MQRIRINQQQENRYKYNKIMLKKRRKKDEEKWNHVVTEVISYLT
jgi:hypothetical protein